ncbi:MAG: response regulator, partial [Bacteroidota bacterium]
MMLKTLIVDDEPLARTGISDYVQRIDFLEEVGQARDGMEALEQLTTLDVDLVFLDVQMPGLNGVDLVRSLQRPPAIIFTTAHPGFALEGFELDAIDYLLKPIPFPRFLKASLKARNRLIKQDNPTAPATPDQPLISLQTKDIFIREEGRIERLLIADILYAESMQNYCRIITRHGSHLPLLPL